MPLQLLVELTGEGDWDDCDEEQDDEDEEDEYGA